MAGCWDLRLCRSYDGPQDPAFRRETLEGMGKGLQALGYFGSDWGNVLEGLRLHPSSTPGEAADRAVYLLSPEGLGRAKELQAIASWLGRDRESLKLTGASPLEAIEQAFKQAYDDLMRAKAAAVEEATCMSLVSIGAAEKLREAIAAGADIAEEDEDGRTPLHYAAFSSQVECIKVLVAAAEEIDGGAAVQEFLDAGDASGRTALHRAAHLGCEDTVKELLRAGASSYVKDEGGDTALHCAARAASMHRGDLWRLEVLLSNAHDLDVDEPDSEGDTVLHFLVKTAEIECIQVLLDAKVDVNVKGERGDTPLHVAVHYEDLDVVELLLNNGADPNARNEDNETPLDIAEERGDEELVDLLTQRQRLQRLQTTSARRLCSNLSSRHIMPTEEVPEGQACVVCLERPKIVILAPCGHRCMCKLCTRTLMTSAQDLRKCPMCKERIESFVTKVFD